MKAVSTSAGSGELYVFWRLSGLDESLYGYLRLPDPLTGGGTMLSEILWLLSVLLIDHLLFAVLVLLDSRYV
jgi:hypothetical protein